VEREEGIVKNEKGRGRNEKWKVERE